MIQKVIILPCAEAMELNTATNNPVSKSCRVEKRLRIL